MAWEVIKHICGHESRRQLYGPRAAREREMARLQGQPCPACRDAAHRAAAEVARQDAERDGLPDLRGSERQVVWALQIRARVFDEIRRCLTAAGPSVDPRVVAAIAALREQSCAAWWIDRREVGLAAMLREAAGER